jgi:hypothetical protein
MSTPDDTAPISPVPPAANLDELLAHQDRAFVYCVYQTLLGREPDENGLRFYSSRLRSGLPKIQVIAEIWRSDEAKEKNMGCAGVEEGVRNFEAGAKPLAKWVTKNLMSEEGDGIEQRRLRGIESQIAWLHERHTLNAARADSANIALRHQLDLLRDKLEMVTLHGGDGYSSAAARRARGQPSDKPSILSEMLPIDAKAEKSFLMQLEMAVNQSLEAEMLAPFAK